LVLRQAVRLASLGAGIGVVVALAGSRILAHRSYGVKPTEVPTHVVSAAIAIVVAVFACYVPAHRAATVDPMLALRHE
jgi:ABC-type antimicrobial peptide transport system permease subunit